MICVNISHFSGNRPSELVVSDHVHSDLCLKHDQIDCIRWLGAANPAALISSDAWVLEPPLMLKRVFFTFCLNIESMHALPASLHGLQHSGI